MDYDIDYIEQLAAQYLEGLEMEKVSEAEYIEKLAEEHLEKLALGSQTLGAAMAKRMSQSAASKGLATSGLKQFSPSNLKNTLVSNAEFMGSSTGKMYGRAVNRAAKREGTLGTIFGMGAGGDAANGHARLSKLQGAAHKLFKK